MWEVVGRRTALGPSKGSEQRWPSTHQHTIASGGVVRWDGVDCRVSLPPRGRGRQRRAAQGSRVLSGLVFGTSAHVAGRTPTVFSLAALRFPAHAHTLHVASFPALRIAGRRKAAHTTHPRCHQAKWMDWMDGRMDNHRPDMRARQAGKCKPPSAAAALGEGGPPPPAGTALALSLLLLLRSKCVLRSRGWPRAIPHPGRWVSRQASCPRFGLASAGELT